MENFFVKMKSFLGLGSNPPRNDFRNPIWGDDDEDDDDLYNRESNMEVYPDPSLISQELTRQMNDMMRTFGSMFSDMGTFFHGDAFTNIPITGMPDISDQNREPESFDSDRLRNYYLKPGYHNYKPEQKQDIDLDGKVSSDEISGMLSKKDSGTMTPVTSFDGSMVPGRSFCQTIITTRVKKPDGTIETHRIIKKGNEVTEETTTTHPGADPQNPINTGLNDISPDNIYQNFLSEFSNLWKHFY